MKPTEPNSALLRLLLPSVRDIIFIFIFWSVLAGPLSNLPLADPDIGWHIRTGEQILATHALPRTDPFSSTMQGQPWFAWEWLYDVALGILHRAAGLNGIVFLCAALVATIFVILLSQLLKRGTSLFLAVVLMLLAEIAARIHLYARPHIVSWLFSLLWFVALDTWERWDVLHKKVPRWLPWFFPLSMVLWVNLHGGWLFGMALLGIYTVAAWVESVRERDPFAAIRIQHRFRAMVLLWLGSAAATFANPYGWRLHSHIYHYLGDKFLMDRIDEFRSPDFHDWAVRSFALILMLTVLAFAGNRPAGVAGKLQLSHLLVALLAVYAGFYSSRNLPISAMLLVLIAGPLLSANLASLGQRPSGWKWLRAGAARISSFSDRMALQELELRGHLWAITMVAFGLVVCLHGGSIGSRVLIHAQFDPKKVPVKAVDFLQQHPGPQPVFSTDTWGGYLIYRLYPARQVVVDDRHDLYGSARMRRYLILTQGEAGWRKVLDRVPDHVPDNDLRDRDKQEQAIRIVLLPADSTLVSLLRELPKDWQVSYEDSVAVVIERR